MKTTIGLPREIFLSTTTCHRLLVPRSDYLYSPVHDLDGMVGKHHSLHSIQKCYKPGELDQGKRTLFDTQFPWQPLLLVYSRIDQSTARPYHQGNKLYFITHLQERLVPSFFNLQEPKHVSSTAVSHNL